MIAAKHAVLVLLVAQNTCLVLLMRYSRTLPGVMYLGSTAVCCDEPTEDCSSGAPASCNSDCAAVFLPFWTDCGDQLGAQAAT